MKLRENCTDEKAQLKDPYTSIQKASKIFLVFNFFLFSLWSSEVARLLDIIIIIVIVITYYYCWLLLVVISHNDHS